MENHLLLVFVFSCLVSVSICCILTDSGGCSMNGLTFGGRLTFLQTEDDMDGESSPWEGKRRFIFETPKSSHPYLNPRRGSSGWGRIWVGNSKLRGCETQTFCPPTWKRSGSDGGKSQDADTIKAPSNLKENRKSGKLIFEWDGTSDKHEYSFVRNGEESNVITNKQKVILKVNRGDTYSFKVRGFSPKKKGLFTKPINGVFHP